MTAGVLVWALLIASAFGFLAEIGLLGLSCWAELRLRVLLTVAALRRDSERLPEGWSHGGCDVLRQRLAALRDRNANEKRRR